MSILCLCFVPLRWAWAWAPEFIMQSQTCVRPFEICMTSLPTPECWHKCKLKEDYLTPNISIISWFQGIVRTFTSWHCIFGHLSVLFNLWVNICEKICTLNRAQDKLRSTFSSNFFALSTWAIFFWWGLPAKCDSKVFGKKLELGDVEKEVVTRPFDKRQWACKPHTWLGQPAKWYINASTQIVFIIWLIVFNFLAWAPWLFKRHT